MCVYVYVYRRIEWKFKYQPDQLSLISIKFSLITEIVLITPFRLCFVGSIHRNMNSHTNIRIFRVSCIKLINLQKLVRFNKSYECKKLFNIISVEIEISAPINFKENKEFKFQTQNALNI